MTPFYEMIFLKEKTWIITGTGFFIVITALFLTQQLGLIGITISSITGNLLILFFSWKLINKKMGRIAGELLKSMAYPTCLMLLLFGIAFIFSLTINISNWINFGLYTVLIGLIVSSIAWFLVLPKNIRESLVNRLKHTLPILRQI